MPKTKPKIGDLGEAVLTMWAAQTGIACQKATYDVNGWDFILELSSSIKVSRLEDTPSKIAALVQVKSSRKRLGFANVKLDTLLDLTRRGEPVFFLFIEFDDDTEAQSVYLVHLGKELTHAVLKRFRKLEAKNDLDGLHKKRMQIKYDSEDELEAPFGDDLISAIRRYIGHPEHYKKERLELLNTLGYGQFQKSASVTALVSKEYLGKPATDQVVDIHLGLLTELRTTKIVYKDERFGIPLIEEENEGPGTMTFTKSPNGKAQIKLHTYDHSKELRLEGDLYTALLSESIPTGESAFRIVASCVEMTTRKLDSNPEGDFTLNPIDKQGDTLLNIDAWLTVSQMITYSQAAKAPLHAQFSFRAAGSPRFSCEIGGIEPIPPGDTLDFAGGIIGLGKRAGLPSSHLVSLEQLRGWETLLTMLGGWFAGGNLWGRFTLDTPDAISESNYGQAHYQLIEFGNHIISIQVFADPSKCTCKVLKDGTYRYMSEGSRLNIGVINAFLPFERTASDLCYSLESQLRSQVTDNNWLLESEEQIQQRLDAVYTRLDTPTQTATVLT